MRCVIHIGTHKTGTSSIQLFCARNRRRLLEHGVYYVLGRHSPKNLNFIGQRLAHGELGEPRALLQAAARDAARKGAHTLLLSAESLYAITTFFGLVYRRDVGDYWATERGRIEALRGLLPAREVRILCYVRRQDRFLESVYNQMVKTPWGFTGTIEDFFAVAETMLDYTRHLDIWADVFGEQNVQARVFERHTDDLTGRFLEHAVGIRDVRGFRRLDERVNERLGRDVLEYKRKINTQPMPLHEAFVHMNVLWRISSELGGVDRYGDFLTPARRAALLEGLASTNARLAQRFIRIDGEGFSPVENRQWSAYPGLSAAREQEIRARHRRAMRSLRVRAELAARNILAALFRQAPAMSRWLWPVRRLIYRR